MAQFGFRVNKSIYLYKVENTPLIISKGFLFQEQMAVIVLSTISLLDFSLLLVFCAKVI